MENFCLFLFVFVIINLIFGIMRIFFGDRAINIKLPKRKKFSNVKTPIYRVLKKSEMFLSDEYGYITGFKIVKFELKYKPVYNFLWYILTVWFIYPINIMRYCYINTSYIDPYLTKYSIRTENELYEFLKKNSMTIGDFCNVIESERLSKQKNKDDNFNSLNKEFYENYIR